MTAIKKKEFVKDILLDIIASLFIAAGINMFSAPNHIVSGGVTGIATIINYFTKIPIGTMALCMNIPLLLVGYKYVGKKFLLNTIRVLVILAICIDYVFVGITPYTDNMLIAAIFGGVCLGVGLGLVIMRGSSTGGADVIIKIIKMKNPHIAFGTIMMTLDFIVIIIGGLSYKSLETVLYALILVYITGEIINKMMRGLDSRKLVIIITSNVHDVTRGILEELSRSATIIDARGAYSNASVNMIVCAVANHEFPRFKQILRATDPKAFVMVTEAGEILGEGFKSIHQDA